MNNIKFESNNNLKDNKRSQLEKEINRDLDVSHYSNINFWIMLFFLICGIVFVVISINTGNIVKINVITYNWQFFIFLFSILFILLFTGYAMFIYQIKRVNSDKLLLKNKFNKYIKMKNENLERRECIVRDFIESLDKEKYSAELRADLEVVMYFDKDAEQVLNRIIHPVATIRNIAELRKNVKLYCEKYKELEYTKVDTIKKEYEDKYKEMKEEYEIKKKRLYEEYEEKNKRLDEKKAALIKKAEEIDKINKSKCPFTTLARLYANENISIFDDAIYYLRNKNNPAFTTADRIERELKSKAQQYLMEYKSMFYRYNFLLDLFPELSLYLENEDLLIKETNSNYDDFIDNKDRVIDWVSMDEYKNMSEIERNQLALDRYKARNKSDWEIGIEYELYIGYLLREHKNPFDKVDEITQFGELKGLEDLGRDIIAQRYINGKKEVLIIQCKRWGKNKIIHENAICQLYGTAIEYKIRNRCDNIRPIFVASTSLSDMAKKFAKILNVEIYEIPMGEYPMIKCNINYSDRIYHLPFDQQYHKTEIKNAGEFYAWTVEEAERKGFRRAKKHLIP